MPVPVLVRSAEIGHVRPTGESGAPCCKVTTVKFEQNAAIFRAGREAADVGDVVADVIDLPLLHEGLPFVR